MNFKIRNDEILVKKIHENINLDNYKKWKHYFTTNCYAYALGLDLRENELLDYAYQPGVISGKIHPNRFKYFLYSTLIDGLYADMDKLGIEIRKVKPMEEIGSDEWKIALFTVLQFGGSIEVLRDFHFMRQVDDGTWYHKLGYFSKPSNRDSNNKIILDPSKCNLGTTEFRQCYSLKLKK